MNKYLGDLYSSYLLSSSGQITCTGLSSILDKKISHDEFTRFLDDSIGSHELWLKVKSTVGSLSNTHSDGVLIVDDHIEEKQYMQENDLISWHYDHSLKRNLKGINQLSVLFECGGFSIPVGFDFVHKTELYEKKGVLKRRSPENKNAKFRKLVSQAVHNKINFEFVLADSWFCSGENMKWVKQTHKKDFIFAIKKNRKVALSLEDKKKGHYQALSELITEDKTTQTVYLKGVDFPLTLVKQVFKNKDESEGSLYLVCSKEGLDFSQITTIYKRRWKVEEHHRSIKSNLNYAKSPAYKANTQQNHCIMCLFAFYEWECITKTIKTNQTALKQKIYINALKVAFENVQKLKQKYIPA